MYIIFLLLLFRNKNNNTNKHTITYCFEYYFCNNNKIKEGRKERTRSLAKSMQKMRFAFSSSAVFFAAAFSSLAFSSARKEPPLHAYYYLPPHARGGIVAEKLLGEYTIFHDDASSEENFLSVPLDHFSSSPEKEMMSVRYFVDDSCFDRSNPRAPIFIQMGGEGEVSGAFCGKYHKEHQALALSVEHRFYGASQPKGGRVDGNMQFLTVEQNLADTAAIAIKVQEDYRSKKNGAVRPLMNFGGSYSGATASFFRQTYPNVTMAACSQSGVVNAILNFTAFDSTVAIALDKPAAGCAARLRSLTAAFVRAKKTSALWDTAKKVMLAPNLIGTPLGDADFWYALADAAAMADQYGHKASLCDALKNAEVPGTSDSDLIKAFSSWVASYWGESFMSGCFYDSECFKQPSWNASGMSRSWRWQKCSELAYLQPGYRGSLRYSGLTLGDLLEQCAHVFSDALPYSPRNFTDYTKAFNKKFHGDRPTATNVFYTDYSDDPWRAASVTRSLPVDQDSPYCYEVCNGCGHCGAGVPSNVTKCADKEAAFVARMLSKEHVDAWIKQ